MIVPGDDSRTCAIATVPTEVLMTVLDYLDLVDVFVSRYVCEAFNASALHVLAGRKQQHQLDHPEDETKTGIAFGAALSKANFFYEKTHPQALYGYWCGHCLQIKGTQFSLLPYQHANRLCWTCFAKSQ